MFNINKNLPFQFEVSNLSLIIYKPEVFAVLSILKRLSYILANVFIISFCGFCYYKFAFTFNEKLFVFTLCILIFGLFAYHLFYEIFQLIGTVSPLIFLVLAWWFGLVLFACIFYTTWVWFKLASKLPEDDCEDLDDEYDSMIWYENSTYLR